MCEILTKINCPHCQSSKVARNGKEKNGNQNLLCRHCGFWSVTVVSGISGSCSGKAGSAFCTTCAGRETGSVFTRPASITNAVQIDEAWGFVGKRRKGKYWLPYAYSPETDEILAYESTASGKAHHRQGPALKTERVSIRVSGPATEGL
ncbi:IS1 family transposase [Rufibacter sediminis]|uniref:InsA N-terminal zinc ribbon domain-containing protein n=1 Tax=Rufibacter sediminis TaxID=2762756 RepID=A0ABR6VPL6_9BACT|nr:hypothetical protein [Rufibacter sediminis]